MEVIRQTNLYELNKGSLQARGLFNISSKTNNSLSLWFDNETKNKLIKMNDKQFNSTCKKLCF